MGLFPLDWRVAPIGSLLLCFGLIIMAIVAPLKIADQINKTLEEEFLFTKVGQPGWDRFVNNTQEDSAPSYLKVWIVNTTNAAAAAQGERPQLQEVGPYVFRQYIINSDYTFSYLMNNYTFSSASDGLSERVITFVPWIFLVWDEGNPENENRTLSDVFNVPNFAVWGVLNSPMMSNNPFLKPLFLEIVVNGSIGGTVITQPSTPFQFRNARELLFGYTDPLLVLLQSLGAAVPSTQFSFIRNQTDVNDARSQVNYTTLSCGFPNTVRFQRMIIWQNKTQINYWNPPLTPEGTPGNYFPFETRGESQPQKLFWAQVGRFLGLHYVGDTDVKGVETFRYRFNSDEIANATENPTNARYFQFGKRGLLNSSTINGVPIYYSWPHFYDGDPILTSWYDGLPKPSALNDSTYLDVQQVIGLTCRGRRRIQGNLPVGGLDNTTGGWNYNMGPVNVWPNYWMSLESEITDDQAEQISDALDYYDRAITAQSVLLVGGGVGAFVAFCVAIYLFYKRRAMWSKGSTIGLLAEEQSNEEVPIGYVESRETQGSSSSYGARS